MRRTDMTHDEELIQGYAEALFSVARAEGVLPTVEDELTGSRRARAAHHCVRP